MRRTILLVSTVALVAACGGDGDTVGSSTTTAPPLSTTPTAPVATTAPEVTTTAPEITTTLPETTTTSIPTTTTTTLPGEVIDFGPLAGDVLMVIGVPFDDHLNVREGPGVDQAVVTTFPPDHTLVVALGETRQIPGALWVAVETEDAPGWVHMGYVGYEGSTYDETARVYEFFGGYPSAGSMTQLGEIVATTFASEEPESRIVNTVEESIGDLGEVTYDVIGIGDDAGLGFRIHVFGEAFEGGFVLKSVEVTEICGRGVSEAGLCV